MPSDHQLSDTERQEIIRDWKDEFHALPDQTIQQHRDSLKEVDGASQPVAGKGKGKGRGKNKGKGFPQKEGKALPDGFGPNKKRLHGGMRSRFSRHMQLVGGSKHIYEMIIYFGKWSIADFEHLTAHCASQSVEGLDDRLDNGELKEKAQLAKYAFRYARSLAKRNGTEMTDADTALLSRFNDGTLLTERNTAVRQYGHGNLIDPQSNEILSIGGSTGGRTRAYHDGWSAPTEQENAFVGIQ